jgi:hypothetical protein
MGERELIKYVFVVASVCLGACSSPPPAAAASCDLRASSPPRCEEYGPYNVAADLLTTFQTACRGTGTWADTPCAREGALGGCRTQDNVSGGEFEVEVTTWYWPDAGHKTADDVQAACRGTFVAP